MTTQVVYLERYDWLIKIYYAIDTYYTDLILDELDAIDCDPDAFYAAAEMLENFEYNTGFTYTDPEKHVTFIILGLTTSAKEFLNTFVHEVGHAAVHIGEECDINPYSEELQYLQADIATQMFEYASGFMCECCRNDINLYNFGKMKIKIKEKE